MTTLHYLDRAFERANLGIEGAETFARNAYEKGKHAAQMPKYEREYMELKDATGISARYYKDYTTVSVKERMNVFKLKMKYARLNKRVNG